MIAFRFQGGKGAEYTEVRYSFAPPVRGPELWARPLGPPLHPTAPL